MRCSCQQCGAYMVQQERGLESRCVCPQCLRTCSACMGTEQQPEHREGLALIAYLRERYDERLSGEADRAGEAPCDPGDPGGYRD